MVCISFTNVCLGALVVLLSLEGGVDAAAVIKYSDLKDSKKDSSGVTKLVSLGDSSQNIPWKAAIEIIETKDKYRALALYAKELFRDKSQATAVHYKWASSVVYMLETLRIKNYGGRTIEKKFYSYASYKADYPDDLYNRLADIWQFWAHQAKMAVPTGEDLVRLLWRYAEKV